MRRPGRSTLFVAVLWGALALGGTAWLLASGRARLERARAAASGPLERAELALEQRLLGEDPSEWLAALELGNVPSGGSYSMLRSSLERGLLPADLTGLPDSPGAGPRSAELVPRLREQLGAPPELAAFVGLDPARYLGPSALGVRGVRGPPAQELPGGQLTQLLGATVLLAQDAARAGEPALALAWMEAGLDVLGWLEALPAPLAHSLWEVLLSRWLGGLEALLPELPPGTRLGALAARLDALDPRARRRAALHGLRVLGLELYRSSGAGAELLSLQERCTWWLVRDLDEAVFLERVERALAGLDAPALPAVVPDVARAGYLARRLTSRLELEALATRSLEAGLVLARLALLAHSDGVDAARRAAGERRSPFDGAPIEARVDADGALELSARDPHARTRPVTWWCAPAR